MAEKGEEQPIVVQTEAEKWMERVWGFIERKETDKFVAMDGLEGMRGQTKSDLQKGVTHASVSERQQDYGRNALPEPDPVTFLELVIEALGDKIMLMLMGAAVLSIILGTTVGHDPSKGWIEGVAILISVTVVVMTSATTDYQKAKKFEELSKDQAKKEVLVIREGEEYTIDSKELVVGDVMLLEGGMQLVADGIYITGQDLKVSEAAMTGESDIIKKDSDKDPFFLSGTQIEEGSGKCLIIAVGVHSFEGRMKQTTTSAGVEETPLQAHLSILADQVGYIGMAAAVGLLVALIIKEVVRITRDNYPAEATRFLDFIIIAISIVVVAIPEGLPLAVTIALSFSMKAMMHDECLVRILASCETMGAATAICSDKTGTLTTNIMTVVQGNIAEKSFLYDGLGIKETTHDTAQKLADKDRFQADIDPQIVKDFCFAIAINSSASEQVINGHKVWVGNKTEQGLLGLVKKEYKYDDMRKGVLEENKRQYPFHSKKKRMTTMVRDSGGAVTIYCKGASEYILEDCTKFLNASGQPCPLTEAKREHFMNLITDMANQGNRTIGVAYSPYSSPDFPDEEPNVEMIFMGVLGIEDPIREAVPKAVTKCHSAGLTVRMVTGDNINTAKAIGKKCRIYDDNDWDVAMEGPNFRAMNDADPERLKKIVPRLKILARSSPQDKFVLVGLLQDLGEVVGVTGDGTNDAPALKLSNVGFAMNTGTDIAKGAADMILMDDNFATVVAAIKWGRAVNDNIRKFLQFQLTVNFAAILLTVVGSLASEKSEEPLKPVQLLWLNLIMDTFAALALSTERPQDASLEREPVFQQAPLISRRMWSFMLVHAAFQFVIATLVMYLGHDWFRTTERRAWCIDPLGQGGHAGKTVAVSPPVIEFRGPLLLPVDMARAYDIVYCREGTKHGTVVFNVFIFFQVFNMFNARKLYAETHNLFEGLWSRSRMAIAVLVIICGFQVFAVEVAKDFMSTVPLDWRQWLISIGFAALELPMGVIVRLLPIREPVPADIQAKRDHEAALRKEIAAGNDPNAGSQPCSPTFARLNSHKSLKELRRASREQEEENDNGAGKQGTDFECEKVESVHNEATSPANDGQTANEE